MSTGERDTIDHCPICHRRVRDFEPGGYEDETGQRGHFDCLPPTMMSYQEMLAAIVGAVEQLRIARVEFNHTHSLYQRDIVGWEDFIRARRATRSEDTAVEWWLDSVLNHVRLRPHAPATCAVCQHVNEDPVVHSADGNE